MTTTLDSSPTRRAAAAPASVAAFTAATSPSTKAVTRPLPTFSQPANETFAAFNMASDASKSATSPFVSIMPNACFIPGFLLFDKLDLRGEVQPAGVGLVGIHVDVEQDVLVHAHTHPLERHGGRAAHPQLHVVAMLHAEVSRLRGVHVGVHGGANHAFLYLDHPAGSHDERAGSAVDIAREADRHVVQAQADGVGEGQFHLRPAADGDQNSEVRKQPAAWTDQRDGLFGGELAGLVERVVNGQLIALPEELVQVFAADVHVARGGVYDQGRGGGRTSETLGDDSPDDFFDGGSGDEWGGH